MEYGYKKIVNLPYKEAVDRTKEELKAEGFGVLTEIDVKKTLKEKLGVDLDNYIILGACHPQSAYEALQKETDIGLMLPCNVVVYEKDGQTFVSAIIPTVAMSMVDNESLRDLAVQIDEKLQRVVDSVMAYS